MKRTALVAAVSVLFASTVLAKAPTRAPKTGFLKIAEEMRCSEYDPDDYSYTSSIEHDIVELQGGVWSPYTLERFDSIKETDIEHIVPRSEAHDSGLCARSKDARRGFARDLFNLTLASPELNRYEKSDKEPMDWLPAENKCWYVWRWIHVKNKWQLTVDQAEIDTLSRIVNNECRGQGQLQRPSILEYH